MRIALAAVVLCLIAAPAASGDGDPASDVLLVQDAFYPYLPRVPASLEGELNALLAASKAERLPLKVAIIGSREDLGAVPTFFGYPQKYADFLEREISYNAPQPLLVVMPAGFGLSATGPAASLAHLSVDAHASPAGLARAAILAVKSLARANGRTLIPRPVPPRASANTTNSRGGGPSVVLLFGLPVLLLLLAGVPVVIRGRRKPRPSPPHQD